MTYRVLFLCTGNICRSAYAELVAARALIPGVEFGSAGTHAIVGAWLCREMVSHVSGPGAERRHAARQVTRELITDADLVVAMAEEHRQFVLDEWPAAMKKTYVIGHLAREMARLPGDATLGDLAPYLWRHRSVASDDDVGDPYGRGPAAAEVAVRAINARLKVLLPALRRLADPEGSRR